MLGVPIIEIQRILKDGSVNKGMCFDSESGSTVRVETDEGAWDMDPDKLIDMLRLGWGHTQFTPKKEEEPVGSSFYTAVMSRKSRDELLVSDEFKKAVDERINEFAAELAAGLKEMR